MTKAGLPFFRPASKRYLNLNRSFKSYQVRAVQRWRRIQMMTFSPKLHNKFKEKLEFHLRISETWYGFEGFFFHSLKFGYENQLLSWYHQPAMTTCQGNGINVSSSRTISLTFFIRNDWKYNFLSRNILWILRFFQVFDWNNETFRETSTFVEVQIIVEMLNWLFRGQYPKSLDIELRSWWLATLEVATSIFQLEIFDLKEIHFV